MSVLPFNTFPEPVMLLRLSLVYNNYDVQSMLSSKLIVFIGVVTLLLYQIISVKSTFVPFYFSI